MARISHRTPENAILLITVLLARVQIKRHIGPDLGGH